MSGYGRASACDPLGFAQGIPDEIIEAAKMDGAGRLVMSGRITIP